MRLPYRARVIGLVSLLALCLAAPTIFSQSGQKNLSFGVFGDTGQIGLGQRKVAQQAKLYRDTKAKFEFAILLGDNVYLDGVGRGLKAHFEEPFSGLLNDGVKFYAVLGNHDIRKGSDVQLKYDKFNMDGRNFYSFDKGDGLIEFFALNSTVLDTEVERLERAELRGLRRARAAIKKGGVTKGEQEKLEDVEEEIEESEDFLEDREKIATQQLPWLKDALAKSKARWKVVFMHHSLYSSAYRRGGHGKNPIVKRLRALLEPLMLSNKVDVFFGGHDHTYERAKPQPPTPQDGHQIHYFTVGASSKTRPGDLDKRSSYFADGEDRRYSFVVAQVSESRMKIEAINDTGEKIDEYEIVKK